MKTLYLRRGLLVGSRAYAPDDFSFYPSSPTVGESVTFNVINPREVTYTWDRTGDGIADYTGTSFSYAYQGDGEKTVSLYANGLLAATKTLYVNPTSGGSGSGPQHTHRLTVNPGGTDITDNDGNHRNFCYAYFNRQFILDSNGPTIAWAPGHLYEDRMMWFLWSYRPIAGAWPGRLLNFHNHPGFGGWAPDGPGDSSLAIDWPGSDTYIGYEGDGTSVPLDGLMVNIEHNGAIRGFKKKSIFSHAQMLNFAAAGTWIDLVAQVYIHSSVGSIKMWAQGNDIPVVDINPAGICWVNQTGFLMYEGMYSGGIPFPRQQVHDYTPMRCGRTLQEALEDGTTFPCVETGVAGSWSQYSGGYPMFSHEVLTPRDASEFRLPVSLGGNG